MKSGNDLNAPIIVYLIKVRTFKPTTIKSMLCTTLVTQTTIGKFFNGASIINDESRIVLTANF